MSRTSQALALIKKKTVMERTLYNDVQIPDSLGVFGVKVSNMTLAPERLCLRLVRQPELISLKDSLRKTRPGTYSNLFVAVVNSDQSRESLIAQLKEKTLGVTLLGGNQSLKCIKELAEEPGSNWNEESEISVRVYVGLTDLQSRKVAADNNNKNEHIPIKIWDLVRQGRSIYYELSKKDYNSCDIVRNKGVTIVWNQAMTTIFPFMKPADMSGEYKWVLTLAIVPCHMWNAVTDFMDKASKDQITGMPLTRMRTWNGENRATVHGIHTVRKLVKGRSNKMDELEWILQKITKTGNYGDNINLTMESTRATSSDSDDDDDVAEEKTATLSVAAKSQ